MGKAMRWLKGLFGIRKESKGEERNNKGSSRRDVNVSGLCHNPGTIPPNITPAEAAWLNSFYVESDDKEQSKHAIAVAAVTAAAADAAIAAAQAAATAVRLTSRCRGTPREKWAAIKIQNVFRGFLARKALKALKGLVKVQAVVRGYLVRKEATATLHGMQALMRAQATLRALKYQSSISLERFQESTTMQIHSKRLSPNASEETAKIVEMDTARPKFRSRRTNTCLSDPYDNNSFQPVPPETSLVGSDSATGGYECCRFSTAQSTPKFANSCGSNTPVTQAQSVCGGSCFLRNNYYYHHNLYPNYMAKTQSFKAKLRSYSAPKQRPEAGPRKKMIESRTSLSGLKMQRSCSQAQGVVNFKNTVMGKLGNAAEFTRLQEGERDL